MKDRRQTGWWCAALVLLAVLAAAGQARGDADSSLVGGRGKQMPPEKVRPEFAPPAEVRSPFVAPDEARRGAFSAGGQVKSGPLTDDDVKAAVEITMIAEGEARVNGQRVGAGKTLMLPIRGQSVELKVLEVDSRTRKVTFQYKERTFIKGLGE